MYDAVKTLFDAYNAKMRRIDEDCRSGAARNDPLLAMQCIQVFGGSGGRGGIRAKITAFKKIGCSPAKPRVGFLCEYRGSLDVQGVTLPPSLLEPMTQAVTGTKRFVLEGDRWIALEAAETVRVIP